MKIISYQCDLCGQEIEEMAMQSLVRKKYSHNFERVYDPENADKHVCESCVRVICGPEVKAKK